MIEKKFKAKSFLKIFTGGIQKRPMAISYWPLASSGIKMAFFVSHNSGFFQFFKK